MIFDEVDRRTGRTHIVCSKYWPDETRFRRRYSNKTLAKQVLLRIETAIALGTWRELKKELTEGPPKDYTIREFADIYLEQYCKVRNRRPDFKEETLEVVKRLVGEIRLREFRRSHAKQFQSRRLADGVSNGTVNRGLSVLSNLLTFALREELIEVFPMDRFGRLPEPEKALRVLEPAEARLLVEKTIERDLVVGVYVGILGETGLRKEEGLRLEWDFVRLGERQLVVEASKDGQVRSVPLSERALELFKMLPRVAGRKEVFVRIDTMERLRAPRRPFVRARIDAGLPTVGFHDLRHYRATQWIKNGVDVRTVQEWLGHDDLQTTMRYVHYAGAKNASRAFEEAETRELAELGIVRKEGLMTKTA